MRQSCPESRRAFTLIELLVVIAIIAILIGLLIPAVQQVRTAAGRTQNINNLKQLGLACQDFHIINNYLPFNGITTPNATSTIVDSGSWAYQILPFLEQSILYQSQSGTPPSTWNTKLTMFWDPLRARAGYASGTVNGNGNGTATVLNGANYTSPLGNPSVGATTSGAYAAWNLSPSGGYFSYGSGVVFDGFTYTGGNYTATFTNQSGAPIVLGYTASGGAVGDSGPTTDYGINPYINDPTGGVATATVHRSLPAIAAADGCSNTILMGQMYYARSDYAITAPNSTTVMPIFNGGTSATSRAGNGSSATTFLQDGTAASINQWGSTLPNGALMAMCDGSVHLFPYTTALTYYLTFNDGVIETVPN